jgi:hypothetical protein
MKKLIAILILILSTNLMHGQGFVEMDTIKNPTELKDVSSGRKFQTIHVDFDGDGLKEYICQTDPKTGMIDQHNEIWIDSDFKKVKSIEKDRDGYDFFRFVNIDSDSEPEIFSATGYPEGMDYCFIDQDLKSGKDVIMFYFNPVILDSENRYWGYPWDITDILLKLENGQVKVKCSLDHDIEMEGEVTRPETQSQCPVICFSGKSTQPGVKVGRINGFEWLTMKEIMDRIAIKKLK